MIMIYHIYKLSSQNIYLMFRGGEGGGGKHACVYQYAVILLHNTL